MVLLICSKVYFDGQHRRFLYEFGFSDIGCGIRVIKAFMLRMLIAREMNK